MLLLVDRRAPVKQAVNAFKQHLLSASVVNLREEKEVGARVVVSTYPTILNMINETDATGLRRFGPGPFGWSTCR